VLARQPWDSLIPHLLKTGADTTSAMEQLKSFSRLLFEWNHGASNLISHNDEPRFVERHLRESIEPAHWLKACGAERWIDFGSGGGLPAIPLGMIGVGRHWTLVESRRSKTLFMRKAIQDMVLSGFEVVHDRLEALSADSARAGTFDGFTSRATTALPPTLELAAPLVHPGGFAFLWKGSRRDEEMQASEGWKESWEMDGMLGVGDSGAVVCRFSRR
jgi:16S rRNA (guanine527-N7)-methyltransferase